MKELKPNKWYSLKDSVPPFNETILVSDNGCLYTSANYHEEDMRLHWYDGDGERADELSQFSHFMIFEGVPED